VSSAASAADDVTTIVVRPGRAPVFERSPVHATSRRVKS